MKIQLKAQSIINLVIEPRCYMFNKEAMIVQNF